MMGWTRECHHRAWAGSQSHGVDECSVPAVHSPGVEGVESVEGVDPANHPPGVEGVQRV